jgi:succinate dehydrogenase flavin-adding protein (antitoxin of CptAB toxin-antitoxin module)
MSAFKAYARHIRDAVITLLESVTYDTGNGAEQAFSQVSSDPNAEFSGEPNCLVYPGKLETKKAARGMQDRTVNLCVFIELKLEKTGRTQAQTYDYMYDLTELVLNALDEGDYDGALNTEDSSIANWIMNATVGRMAPAKSKAGVVLLCRIDLAVSYQMAL